MLHGQFTYVLLKENTAKICSSYHSNTVHWLSLQAQWRTTHIFNSDWQSDTNTRKPS